MKNNLFKKGQFYLCALALAGATLFAACGGTSGTEYYGNAVSREQRYSEEISDTKENDRETEQELQDIMDAAEGVSLNDSGEAIPVKETAPAVSSDKTGYEQSEVVAVAGEDTKDTAASNLQFRKKKYLDEHYEKHGIEMGFANADDYLAAANKVLDNPNVLHKKEKEDNDEVYYLEETNEFVVVSDDGYIRTYFNPNAGIDYYNRQ